MVKTKKITSWLLTVSLFCLSQVQGQDAYYNPCFEQRCTPTYDCNTYCDQFWVNAEYLYWKIKDSPEPTPLVYQATLQGQTIPVLGAPGTFVVLGGKDIHNDWQSGGRFSLGYAFNRCYSSELSYFFLPKSSKSRSIRSNGSLNSPLLLIPFF